MGEYRAFEREMQETYFDVMEGLSALQRQLEAGGEEAGGEDESRATAIAAIRRLKETTERHFDTLGALFFEDVMHS